MKVSYGEDIAYVQVGHGEVAKTKEIAPGLLLDLDQNGQALGIEVVGLAHRGLPHGIVEVELAKGAEGEDEQRLGKALFGDEQQQAQAH